MREEQEQGQLRSFTTGAVASSSSGASGASGVGGVGGEDTSSMVKNFLMRVDTEKQVQDYTSNPNSNAAGLSAAVTSSVMRQSASSPGLSMNQDSDSGSPGLSRLQRARLARQAQHASGCV